MNSSETTRQHDITETSAVRHRTLVCCVRARLVACPNWKASLGKYQRGVAAIEFALVFPVFFLIFYGMVTYALIFVAQQSLTLAAAEGARSALVVGVTQAEAAGVACTRAAVVASWLNNWQGTNNLVCNSTATPAPCPNGTGTSIPTCLTVIVSFPYAAVGGHPLVPTLPGFGLFLPSTLTSSAVVQLGG